MTDRLESPFESEEDRQTVHAETLVDAIAIRLSAVDPLLHHIAICRLREEAISERAKQERAEEMAGWCGQLGL